MFKGIGIPIFIPFLKDGKVDFKTLENLIFYYSENPAQALILFPSIEQKNFLEIEEKVQIIDAIVKSNLKNIPLVIQIECTNKNTIDIIEECTQFSKFDFQSFIFNVEFSKSSNSNDIYKFFVSVQDFIKVPFFINTSLINSKKQLDYNLIKQMESIRYFYGFIENNNNISLCIDIKRQFPKLKIYSTDDFTILPFLSIGIDGVISNIAAIIPNVPYNMYRLFLESKIKEALKIQLNSNYLNTLLKKSNISYRTCMKFLDRDLTVTRFEYEPLDNLTLLWLKKEVYKLLSL